MIPVSMWLTDAQLVVGGLGVLLFLAAVWVKGLAWVVDREKKTACQVVGFVCLVVWSAVYAVGTDAAWLETLQTGMLFVGLAMVTTGVMLEFPARRLAGAAKLPPVKMKPATVAAPVKAAVQAGYAVKLPAANRKKMRAVVNTIVGIVVFVLAGLAAFWAGSQFFKAEDNKEVGNDAVVTEEEPVVSPSSEPSPSPVPSPELPKVTVTDTETGYLNVREGPGTGTEIIDKINPGEDYPLLEEGESGLWYKIQVDENTAGWVSAEYVTTEN